MDYNQEEKNQLNQKLREEMARQKAEQLGVDASDVMQKVWDGKSSWVRKSDVYIQLDKQRKLVAPPKVMRSLRDGQNSLVSRIQREINLCRNLSTDLSKETSSSNREISEVKTSIVKLENRTNSLESQLMDVESRIDRSKAKDPVFAQAESVLAQMRDRNRKNDREGAQLIMAENKDLLGKYDFIRKSLVPLLDEARKKRLELQKEYSQIMRIRFKLQSLSIQSMKQRFADMAAESKQAGRSSALLKEAAALVRDDELNNKQFFNLASHIPPSHVPLSDASKMWDCLLPEMTKSVDVQAEHRQKFAALLAKSPSEDKTSDLSFRRMAFSQQKKR